jgi:amino acid transporter
MSARGTSRPLGRIFAVPALLFVLTALGLAGALLGDGIWDVASWIALAIPLAVIVWCLLVPVRDA